MNWLSQNLENPKVRIIKVNVGSGICEKGHTKGALHFHWHTDFVDQP
ncbi:hypothetical protein AB3N59_04905 [Leptospira sp. WS92.C1]